MGTEKIMQPSLIHVPTISDCHAAPFILAKDIVDYFSPTGRCLDPCRGDGAFYDLLPPDADWCEIEPGRDFYAWSDPADWIISNPPYSHYSAWLRPGTQWGFPFGYALAAVHYQAEYAGAGGTSWSRWQA